MGIVGALQRSEHVSKLKVPISNIRLFGYKFFERYERSFEIFVVNVPLCLIEQIVQRIGKFLSFGGYSLISRCLGSACIGNGSGTRAAR